MAAAQESEEEKRVLIEGFQDLRQEEALLLERIAQAAQAIPEPDEALLALVDEASRATAEDLSLAQSQLPQPALPPSDPPLPSAPELSPAARLAQRILIYSTLQGQSNQMERLLDGQESLGFLTELKGLLPARTGDLLGRRILEAQRKERAEAGEQVEARIEEAQAQYQQSLEGLKLAEPMPAEAAPTSVPLLLPAPAEPALAPIEAPIPAEAETEAERTLP